MNILIVDDQVAVLRGLERGVDWKKLGFSRVYTAGSAGEAKLILINYSKIYNVDLKGTPALLLYTHHSLLLPIKVKGWQQDGKLLLS